LLGADPEWYMDFARYRLKPEDVATKELVLSIIPKKTENNKTEYLPTDIWDHPQWRKTIVASGHACEEILRSMFATAYSIEQCRPDTVGSWLQDVIAVTCFDHPEFQPVLCRIAWNDHLFTGRYARRILMAGTRLDSWMTEQDAILMNTYIQNHWDWLIDSERYVLDKLRTPEEQRTLFFNQLENPRHTLVSSPRHYAHLFQTEQEKDRLATWLVTHYDRILNTGWFACVKYFQLQEHPLVKRQLWNILDATYDNPVKQALTLLNP
jgi:hypothetical protein